VAVMMAGTNNYKLLTPFSALYWSLSETDLEETATEAEIVTARVNVTTEIVVIEIVTEIASVFLKSLPCLLCLTI
jgi:hypothetical protein